MRVRYNADMASDRDIPRTGPQAILHALQQMDLDAMEAKAREEIKSGKKTKRPKAVAILNAIAGMRKNELSPSDFMVETVPVIPHQFRPYSVMGSTFIPGDANVLYGEVIDARNAHNEEKDILGEENSGPSLLNMYDAVKAVYGYGDPVKEKTRQKEVKGFLSAITGSTSKYGFVNRKLLSKPQDNTGRSTIVVDPELGLDEIGMPTEMAFTVFAPFVQRKLRQMGYGAADSIKHWKDRTDTARKALVRVLEGERGREQGQPAVYTRAPAWHGPSILSGYVKLRDGEALAINPYVTTGLGADFDGDSQIGRGFIAIERNRITHIFKENDLHIRNLSFISASPSVSYGDSHSETMFTNAHKLNCYGTDTLPLELDFADFPHGELANTNKENGYDIEFYSVPAGVRVPAYNESTGTVELADVKYWSKHQGRAVEIVNLSDGFQIYTDNDPRAVYGISSKATTLVPQRFTPTDALIGRVMVPVATEVPRRSEADTILYDFATGELTLNHTQYTTPLDFDFGQFVGVMCGDGWTDCARGAYHIADLCGCNARFVEKFIRNLFQEDISVTLTPASSTEDGRHGSTVKHTFRHASRHMVMSRLRELVDGARTSTTSGSGSKRLPLWFAGAPREFLRGIVCGLIATDGSVSISGGKEKPQLMLGFGSTSLRLCRELRRTLQLLGIQSSITFSKKTKANNDMWQLTVSTVGAKRENILQGCCHTDKEQTFVQAEVSDDPTNVHKDIVPFPEGLSRFVIDRVTTPKTSSAYKQKFKGTEEEWQERVKQATFGVNMYFAAKKGYITRNMARKLISFAGTYAVEKSAARSGGEQVVRKYEELLQGVRNVPFETRDRPLLEAAIDATAPEFTFCDPELKAAVNHTKRQVSTMDRKGKATRANVAVIREFFAKYSSIAAGPDSYPEWSTWVQIVNSNTKWVQVESVEATGKVETGYDLTVPGYETFASADGIILSNTINVHAPATPRAIEEARTIMLPSYQPFSNREEGSIVPAPKQEAVLSYYTANKRPAEAVHTFDTEEDALKAIRAGKVPLHDEIEVRGGIKMAGAYDRPSEPPVSTLEEKRPVKDPATGKFMPTVRKLDGGEVQGDSEEHKKE